LISGKINSEKED